MKRFLIFCLMPLVCCVFFYSCQKEYSIENGLANGVSAGTLKDSAGNCLPEVVFGTYYNGVTPGDTNYVQVEVNVVTAGSYIIKTDIQNGFQFADSGFFNNTGLNSLKLKVIGTPILNVSTNFTIGFDSSFCMFTVNVKDSTGSGQGGGGGIDSTNSSDTAWQFTEGNNYYHGPFSGAFLKDTSISGTSIKALVLEGTTFATGDTLITLGVLLPTGIIYPGTYMTNTAAGFEFTTLSGVSIYSADPYVTTGAITSIIISSYTNNIVQGIFSGTAKNANGINVNITNGTFKAKVM